MNGLNRTGPVFSQVIHPFSVIDKEFSCTGNDKSQSSHFAGLCLPQGGGYFCLVDISCEVAHHTWFNTKKAMLDSEVLSSPLGELYYATATFREAGTKFSGRKADKTLALRALRLDADVDWKFAVGLTDKQDQKKYATKQDALVAIKAFSSQSRLPRPLIVDSGNGYHCYWPLSQDAPCDWRLKTVLEHLKNLYNKLGFRFDDAVTTDFARVLRLPGTFNGKNKTVGPQQVHVFDWGDEPSSLDELEQIIFSSSSDPTTGIFQMKPDGLDEGKALTLEPDAPMLDFLRVKISENKKAIQRALDHLATKGYHEREPDWYLVIKQIKGALAEKCHTGEERKWLYEKLRAWSARSTKHTDEILQRKFDKCSEAGSLRGLFSIASKEGWQNPGADIYQASDISMDEAERRKLQQDQDRIIGEGEQPVTRGLEHFQEAEVLDRFVLLKSGSFVFDRLYPREILAMSDFNEAYRASTTQTMIYDSEASNHVIKRVGTVNFWRKSQNRRSVFSQTFMPGKPEFLTHNGQELINTWQPYERIPPKEIDRTLVAIFVRHVHYLFGRRTNDFLDWIAHVEQHPGVLRHTAWLHVSTVHGRGRNWMLGLLARVWHGQTAACFDLGSYLKTGFNGELSRKVFAYVDEIKAQTSDRKWDEGNRLRELVNQEFRMINAKYGRQHIEMNCCGWVVCSNYRNALAIDNDDRRWECVLMPDAKFPKDSAYYKMLYRLRDDPRMIESVAAYLHYRDISKFNPGRHAKRDKAKTKVINSLRTEVDLIVGEIKGQWPVDVISNEQLKKEFDVDSFSSLGPSHYAALDRVGITSVAKQAKMAGRKKTRYRIIRNHDKWEGATSQEVFLMLDIGDKAQQLESETMASQFSPETKLKDVLASWGMDED